MSRVSLFRRFINRYLIDGLSGMALGLFLPVIVGHIIERIGAVIGGSLGVMLLQILCVILHSCYIGDRTTLCRR